MEKMPETLLSKIEKVSEIRVQPGQFLLFTAKDKDSGQELADGLKRFFERYDLHVPFVVLPNEIRVDLVDRAAFEGKFAVTCRIVDAQGLEALEQVPSIPVTGKIQEGGLNIRETPRMRPSGRRL